MISHGVESVAGTRGGASTSLTVPWHPTEAAVPASARREVGLSAHGTHRRCRPWPPDAVGGTGRRVRARVELFRPKTAAAAGPRAGRAERDDGDATAAGRRLAAARAGAARGRPASGCTRRAGLTHCHPSTKLRQNLSSWQARCGDRFIGWIGMRLDDADEMRPARWAARMPTIINITAWT